MSKLGSSTCRARLDNDEALMKAEDIWMKNDNIFNYKSYFKKKYLEYISLLTLTERIGMD